MFLPPIEVMSSFMRATPAELEQMKKLLAQGMEDGAAGLVMALETPGEEQFPPEGQPSLSMPTTEDLMPVRIGVVGAGALGFHHTRILRDVPGAQLIGFRASSMPGAAEAGLNAIWNSFITRGQESQGCRWKTRGLHARYKRSCVVLSGLWGIVLPAQT